MLFTLILKIAFRSYAKGRQWRGIYYSTHYYWWTASKKTEAAVFIVQVMLPEGFPFHQFNTLCGWFWDIFAQTWTIYYTLYAIKEG